MTTTLKRLLFFFVLNILALNAFSQTDTLRLSFKDAEKRFLENNFSLLAQKYNVNATQALVQQAGLWDNPVLSTDQNITDATGKYFNHSGDNGQIFVQLSQLIQTAGKRGKQIRVAKDAAKVQEAAFNDVLRNLRYNLQLDMAQTANLIAQRNIYLTEIASATDLVSATERSFKLGNSSEKDVVRLKALLFNLRTELVDNDRQLADLQKELRTLLAVNVDTFIAPQLANTPISIPVSTEALVDQAKASRADYLADRYTLDQNNSELTLQKALAKPDVTIGASFDQNSSYVRNVVGLQISMPIPLLNRNQGNIKSAMYAAKSQEAVVKNSEMEVKNDVYNALQQLKLSQQLNTRNETDFYDRYDAIFNAMLKSFQQRQINLMEFVDFFDSYKDTKIKILQQQYGLQKSIADLNYAVGTNVIPAS